MELTEHERRILSYIDQRGSAHRGSVVADLARPGSRIADRGGKLQGSNGAAPMIMARWCRRLIKAGYLREQREYPIGFYRGHEITKAGREALRNG